MCVHVHKCFCAWRKEKKSKLRMSCVRNLSYHSSGLSNNRVIVAVGNRVVSGVTHRHSVTHH